MFIRIVNFHYDIKEIDKTDKTDKLKERTKKTMLKINSVVVFLDKKDREYLNVNITNDKTNKTYNVKLWQNEIIDACIKHIKDASASKKEGD